MKKIAFGFLVCLLLVACEDENENKSPSVCTTGQTQCTSDGLIQTCLNGVWSAGVSCGANQTCQGSNCVENSANLCITGQTQCTSDGLIQTCANGVWSAGVSCGANQTCQSSSCVENAAEGKNCGAMTCTLEQLCLNDVCVDRDNKAEAGKDCNPKTFIESCDGNKLVYCDDTVEDGDPVTRVTDCEDAVCALRSDMNFGFCVKTDPACTAPGEMTLCHDEAFSTSYLEHRECALATDGKYYPFRMDWGSDDCIGACVDAYHCNTEKGGTYQCTSTTSYCLGDIVVYCDDMSKPYAMNCADYNGTCDSTKGDCVYE